MAENKFLVTQLKSLPYFRALIRSVEATYYQELPLPAPVIDVGCGDGSFAALTFSHKLDVGLDPWHKPIHEAKGHSIYHFLVESDGGKAPFAPNSFASGLSNSVLEHIPHVEAVLADTARVLKKGAPFYFCVPNPRYLSELSLPKFLGRGYTQWFKKITRVVHADEPEVWRERLGGAGFELERWWHYFSPAALRMLEWGHYFGLPSLLFRQLTHRWILSPTRWNLGLTEKVLRRYASPEPLDNGTFTFYIARKK